MGLFQNLLETYERCSATVGISQIDADGNVDEKKTLLPIFHTTFKSEICITIDKFGKFIGAARSRKVKTIIIPCTESSAGRSNGISAHPLCDQLDYISGVNGEKTNAYLSQLNSWKNNNAELNAIYSYISGKTILNDLLSSEIFKESEFLDKSDEDTQAQLDNEKTRKIGVSFAVYSDGKTVNVWESRDLRDAWIRHISTGLNLEDEYFDYLSGRTVSNIATQHPKNINSFTGNAKLISCNDTSGFTFRGRFAKQDDAVIVDYVSSQKVHQMLRWLIASYGYAVDSQVIVTWAVDDDTKVKVQPQEDSYEIFSNMQTIKTDTGVLSSVRAQIYVNYAEMQKKLLQGYGSVEKIKEHSLKICIAAFDAATTGRMGLVFYQELFQNEYLENIVNWHVDTSYFLTAWEKDIDKKGKEKNKPIHYIGAPSYDDILFAVYGRARGDKSYSILKKKMRKQLLECMFGNAQLPKNLVEMAVNRASNPMKFTDSNNAFSENDWNRSINISCALIRKFYKQQKEEISLELETGREERDYLFGRLLSVADKLESAALYKADKKDTRATNATRLMSAFQVKPYSTWGQLYSQLIPYKNQLNGAGYYQALIDSIMVLFKNGEYEDNSPLSPLYLLGYSAQNRAFMKNKNEKSKGDHNDNATE